MAFPQLFSVALNCLFSTNKGTNYSPLTLVTVRILLCYERVEGSLVISVTKVASTVFISFCSYHLILKSHFTLAQRVRALFPKLDATFFGTGDLFSSLILAYFEKCNDDLDMAVCVLYIILLLISLIAVALSRNLIIGHNSWLISLEYWITSWSFFVL